MKTKEQTLFEKHEKKAYATPQLTIHGSVADITAQSPPPKVFGNGDGAVWNQQSVTWGS